jgi:hypothetical protein
VGVGRAVSVAGAAVAVSNATVRKVVISLIAAIALVGIGIGFSGSQTPKPSLPDGVRRVYPDVGAFVLRQSEIGVDLNSGLTGMLFLDGAEIPEDDIQRVPATGKISLHPQPDSTYAELSAGHHCASVDYWAATVPRPEPATNHHEWCFNLH